MNNEMKFIIIAFIIIGVSSLVGIGIIGSASRMLNQTGNEGFCATTNTIPDLSVNELIGEELFRSNCSACHHVARKMTGPAMSGVMARHDKEWILSWVRDSQQLIAEGDSMAIARSELEDYPNRCLSFPSLSEEEIISIFLYSDVNFQH